METAYETLKKKIDRNDLIILDGGVGTELQFRGIETVSYTHLRAHET